MWFFFDIEGFLERRRYYRLAGNLRDFKKLFYSSKQKKSQLEWIDKVDNAHADSRNVIFARLRLEMELVKLERRAIRSRCHGN